MTTLEPATFKHQAIVKKVYQAFFTPSKYEVKAADQAMLERGDNDRVLFGGGELAVTTWGSPGPSVLLMHGWGGSRAQMTGFVDPLLKAGYRVVAYDQPAHGASDGITTNILEIAPTMDLITEREGKFSAIIAHSFGTLITSYALVKRNFPSPARLVYFGAFNRLLDSLPRFQVLAGLSDEIMTRFREMLYENFGQELLESITNESLTPQINIPALMFHDVTDNVTPISDSRAIAQVWKNAKLI
ncbi:MAG: alpha/beta fold hydrolase, partial [Chloroflexi bacterium]|nr:alpha/beta fold hydrolase [Chloroflexota bacterium]